jgi:O-antigen biosynthesis protein WbqP
MHFAFKRAFDFAFSIAAAIMLFPLMAAIAVAVGVFDGFPIFFAQDRVGKGGKLFRCYKYRTMKAASPAYMPKGKIDHSFYVTKLGSFLRSFSLDELPQLFNVIKGEMSIVGPRPIIADEANIHILRKERGIESAKPGITGLAQIMGRDALSDVQKADYDKAYCINSSIIMDVWIILMTFGVIVHRNGYKENI